MSSFDLNLTRVFVLLYETRSVTTTAEVLHVSQPTISYGLGKLRRRFEDDLFHRSRMGLMPTALADRLYRPLQQALMTIDEVVDPTQGFEPLTDHAQFTIGLSDLGESSLLPRLVEPLLAEAPHSSLAVRPLDLKSSPDHLERGDLDAFVATPVLSSPLLRRIPLFAEGYLLMVDRDHPRLRGDRVTVAQLRAEHHIIIDGSSGHIGPRLALETLDLADQATFRANRFSTLPHLIQGSELVAIVPEYAGRAFAVGRPLRLLGLPITLEPLDIALYARPERSRSLAQRWLIDFLYRHLADITHPSPPRTQVRSRAR